LGLLSGELKTKKEDWGIWKVEGKNKDRIETDKVKGEVHVCQGSRNGSSEKKKLKRRCRVY